MKPVIDLRSDTVTQPTPEMREAMANAIVGDDVYGEDPTVVELEQRVARIFQKESALFFPSGTMCNLTAILSWCSNRGSEVIVGDKSHIFLFEQTGASQFGGVSLRTVPNLLDGTLDIDQVKLAIRDEDIHEPTTELLCIENTHNVCGGKVLPLSFMEELYTQVSRNHSYAIPIHLDGARIWNAISASGLSPSDITKYVDSLSVCLSKGLGAPVGSLLVGCQEFINKARRIRKALGGGMRQSGVLAAAGLQALDDFEKGILVQDHYRAARLAKKIESFAPAFKLFSTVETNILFLSIVKYNRDWDSTTVSSQVSKMCKEKGILISAWSPFLIRMVIHRDINDEKIDYVIQCVQEISHQLIELSN
jgi:threonine aldolase